jgi:hypothetical protein
MKHCVVVSCCFLASIICATAAADKKRPFSIADSISMTRLADPDTAFAEFIEPEFKVSADKRTLAFVTRSGNVVTGLNEFSLNLVDCQSIEHYLGTAPGGALPTIQHRLTFHTSSIWPGIDRMTWMPDARHLAFIGRREDKVGQVYLYDVVTGSLQQLTHHATNVMRFALSADMKTLVYGAHFYPDWDERNSRGYVVNGHYAGSLTWVDPTNLPPEIKYFVADVSSGKTTEVNTPSSKYAENIFLSSTGRFALLNIYDVTVIPRDWMEYEPVRERLRGALEDGALAPDTASGNAGLIPTDAFASKSGWLTHPLILDTRSGNLRPLVDAPFIAGGQFVKALWSSDESQLIVGPVLLPLTKVPPAEKDERRKFSAVAQVQVNDGAAVRIFSLHPPERLTALERLKSNIRVTVANPSTGHEPQQRLYSKSPEGWAERTIRSRASADLVFGVVQSMNQAPELGAAMRKGSDLRPFTDLNPSFRDLELGAVDTFDWTDRLGRAFRGGIILPPDYVPGRRYPVVLQTYGFNPDAFLVDGPFGMTSAYAARPLAAAGMIVLQMPYQDPQQQYASSAKCSNWNDCGENPRFLAMLEGAIAALNERGLVDAQRVGVIGFSREGMHVFYAVTFSRYPIAAATIADSIAPSPFAYALFYGFGYPGMLEFEDRTMMGGEFWGQDIDKWRERAPIFHLDRIQAALRIETYSRAIPGYWDVFAIMRRHLRPVEMIHLPLDTHTLQTPFGRLLSQQGNVDWFRFWLKDEEDNSGDKDEQYRRWRELKQQATRERSAAAE